MTATFTHVETYEIEHCCTCGIPFAVTSDFQKQRRLDHQYFYCPAGHPQHYAGKSEAEQQRDRANRLERQLANREEDLRSERASHTSTRRKLAASKGQLTKTKNRVAAGVCTCCNRTFANLARHMTGQHLNYTQEN